MTRRGAPPSAEGTKMDHRKHVGALRAKTDAAHDGNQEGAPEAGGDMERAEELMRVKLGSKAGNAASRSPPRASSPRRCRARPRAMVEVNC